MSPLFKSQDRFRTNCLERWNMERPVAEGQIDRLESCGRAIATSDEAKHWATKHPPRCLLHQPYSLWYLGLTLCTTNAASPLTGPCYRVESHIRFFRSVNAYFIHCFPSSCTPKTSHSIIDRCIAHRDIYAVSNMHISNRWNDTQCPRCATT